MSNVLRGRPACDHAALHGLRIIVADSLILDPADEYEASELVRLIVEGHGERLTVEMSSATAEAVEGEEQRER